jgi:RNA polymerase sigma factor (TIGR02999 family)
MTKAAAAVSKDEFFSAAYEELRRVARNSHRGHGNLTLNPTAMVNEVYIRLAEAKSFQPASPEHLKHTVIRAMRHVLVDAARRKTAERRGGGSMAIQRVPFDESIEQSAAYDPTEVLNIDFALDELARQSEFQARAFECQFFGGLQVAEIAQLVGASEKKVQRSLRLARAFLTVALSREKPDDLRARRQN